MINRSSWHQKAILFLFHFLLLATPLFFSFNTEELFEFNKMVLTYAITALIVIVWLLRMVSEKRFILKRTVFDIPLLLFLISQIAATFFSMHPRTSMLGYYSRFHGGLWSIISYYALYYSFVSNLSFKAIPQLFYTTFISAAIASIYGILEHFGHSPSCFLLTNGESFGVDCWVQKVQDRVFATFGQPNWLAAYAITLIPVGIVMTVQKKGHLIWKLLVGTSTISLFLVLLFTKSRSGLLGFTGGMLVMLAGLSLLGWQQEQLKGSLKKVISQPIMISFVGFAIAFAVLISIFGTPYTPSLSQVLNKPQEPTSQPETTPRVAVNRLEVGGTDSGEIRKIVWDGAINVWQRYPFFGSGVETFAYSYYQDRPVEHNMVSEWDFLYNKAHNEFLNFLATTGIAGLATYLLLLGWFTLTALFTVFQKQQTSQQPSEKQLITLGLLAGITALSISNFFGFSTVMVTILMFLFFAMAALPEISKEKNHSSSYSAGWQFGLSSLIVLFGLVLLSRIYNYRQADSAFSQGKDLLAAGQTQLSLASFGEAIKRSPNEALFYDELSETYGRLAVATAGQNEATGAAELASTAITLSDRAMELNPHHLNFYKTRIRLFIMLAQIQPSLLENARDTLESAIDRSPTDAKLWYNLGLVELRIENQEASIAALEKAVELKPDYESARLQLAKEYQAMDNPEAAITQYQYVLENISADNPTALEALSKIE